MRSSMHMTSRSVHIYLVELVWEVGRFSISVICSCRYPYRGAVYVICQTLISIYVVVGTEYGVVFAQLYPLFQFQLKGDLEGM